MKIKDEPMHGEVGHFCHGGCAKGYAKGGMIEPEKTDPLEMPEDIKEMIKQVHKDTKDSRPDESWRIARAESKEPIAGYMKDDDKDEQGWMDLPADVREEGPGPNEIPNYDEGGVVDADPNALLQKLAPTGSGMIAPSPAAPPPMAAPGPIAPPVSSAPAPAPPKPATPALTDQDFMNRANKMLGLGPQDQAGFMKLLGDRSQKGQIGAGLAGIGDAIASGGTLGKVNPGALARSEDIIQGKEKAGIEGMQTIRGNQEKAFETADKLELRDPKSPLSLWAQKAYGPVGKKIGIDLSNAPASMIADITGKGVEALNTEYQNQLKMAGLDLQKKQVEATIGNQKAERDIAREGHQAEAAKTLAGRGLFSTLANSVPFTSGREATKILEKQAQGASAPPYGQETTRNGKTYEWSAETGKYHLKQ